MILINGLEIDPTKAEIGRHCRESCSVYSTHRTWCGKQKEVKTTVDRYYFRIYQNGNPILSSNLMEKANADELHQRIKTVLDKAKEEAGITHFVI